MFVDGTLILNISPGPFSKILKSLALWDVIEIAILLNIIIYKFFKI
jgi:hypothetical protein